MTQARAEVLASATRPFGQYEYCDSFHSSFGAEVMRRISTGPQFVALVGMPVRSLELNLRNMSWSDSELNVL